MNFVRYASIILLTHVGWWSACHADDLLAPFLGEPTFEKQRLFDDQRYPNVVVTTKGTVLAVWGNDGVVVRRSVDGGKSWRGVITVTKAGYHGGGTTVDANSGDILVFVEDKQPPAPLTIYRSWDDGRSWQAQTTTMEKDGNGNTPSMHMNEHGVTLLHGPHKGRLIRPSRYYGPEGGDAEWPLQYTNAIFSDDGGKSWKTSKPFPEKGTGEATLVELADGRIYYNSRVHWSERPRNKRRREAWSEDGGVTWTNYRIIDALPDGDQGRTYGCMGGLTRLPLKDRDILLFSNLDTNASHRERVTVWASFDGGKTWPIKRLIDADRSGYSSMVVGRHGTPSAGWIYVQYEHDPFKGAHIARFNLAWVLGGKPTGDGEVPTISLEQKETSSGSVNAEDSDQPRVEYPGSFSRPRSQGKDYNTWAGAKGPDVGETNIDPSRLPLRVDNSDRPQFPPVYKQKWGACGQFASVASIFTYEMNVLNGTVADSVATRFPAHFSWNMMNKAKNVGSEAYHGWEVAKRIGVPTAKSYGGVSLDKIGVWPNGYHIWREAMEYRISGYRYTPANTVAQLNEARGWLFDRNQPLGNGAQTIGGGLALDGRMGEKKKVTKTIPEKEYAAGEDVWIRWGPSGYGHGITCVGYDDRVGYDVNGDGKITNDLDTNDDGKVTLADWERGAFIVVNSWGEKWSKDGKIYLLYSAMIDPTWERGNYLGRAEVTRYVPRRTLKLKLACNDRTSLRMTIGVASDEKAIEPEHELSPEAFNGWPLFRGGNAGYVPMAGPDDDTPIEVGIDLTPLLDKLGSNKDEKTIFFLQLTRADDSEAEGKLLKCAIRTYDSKGQFQYESEVEIEGGTFGENDFALRSPGSR